jgi:putative ABC transport system permease protein
VRFSLGAGRWRIGRQLLTESLALAAVGGVLGVGVGSAGLPLLAYVGTKDLPRAEGIHLDGTVLAFSLAVALLTGLVSGSVPLFNVIRRNRNDIFRQGGRTGTTDRRAMWTRSTLVVWQVSLAFVLDDGATAGGFCG